MRVSGSEAGEVAARLFDTNQEVVAITSSTVLKSCSAKRCKFTMKNFGVEHVARISRMASRGIDLIASSKYLIGRTGIDFGPGAAGRPHPDAPLPCFLLGAPRMEFEPSYAFQTLEPPENSGMVLAASSRPQ